VADALVEFDRDDEGVALARRIGDAEERAQALRNIAARHALDGKWDEARGVWALIPRGAARDAAIDAAVQRAIEAIRYDDARLIARERSEPLPSLDFIIASDAARHRRFGDLQRALPAITDPVQRASVLLELGAGLVAVGVHADALPAFREARRLAERDIPEVLRDTFLGLIGEGLASAGALSEALEIADANGRDDLYAVACQHQVWTRDLAGAQRTLSLVPREAASVRETCAADIVAARVYMQAEPPQALERIADASLRVDMAIEAARHAKADGDFARAEMLLTEARSAASSIANALERDQALGDILDEQSAGVFSSTMHGTVILMRNPIARASGFAALGVAQMADGAQRDVALSSFQEALRTGAGAMPTEDYAFIVEQMAEAGLVDEAFAAARVLPSQGQLEEWARDNALVSVSTAYAKAGRYYEAFAAASEVQIPAQRVRAYLKIAGHEE
jgi:tetratricopeptide (TPR) repeat protein